jgi:hypothetical protein
MFSLLHVLTALVPAWPRQCTKLSTWRRTSMIGPLAHKTRQASPAHRTGPADNSTTRLRRRTNSPPGPRDATSRWGPRRTSRWALRRPKLSPASTSGAQHPLPLRPTKFFYVLALRRRRTVATFYSKHSNQYNFQPSSVRLEESVATFYSKHIQINTISPQSSDSRKSL